MFPSISQLEELQAWSASFLLSTFSECIGSKQCERQSKGGEFPGVNVT